ncbi:hypothetical protein BJV78DRAFT_1365850 [Lactifluus subvellereus]|nr:hypothetical protein BJV78DRAFT_1365850 [Lactifluus subvellereus]
MAFIVLREVSAYFPSSFSPSPVDTSVFGFSPGNLFNVDSVAKRSLIISSVAAAIGLFIDVWLIFAYSGMDVHKFQAIYQHG